MSQKKINISMHKKLVISKSPLHLYRQLYCQNCADQDFCKVNFEHCLLCILAKIAHEVAWKNRLTEKLNSHKL